MSMIYLFLMGITGCILFMLVRLTYQFNEISKNADHNESDDTTNKHQYPLSLSLGFIYTLIVISIIALLFLTWLYFKGTPYEAHFMEWMNIIVRLMHITFGIVWIGASFYFVWLENALNRTKDVREELAGNLWAVHGGGFYYLEKYKIAPKVIPKDLHWFKYESYFTWLSGIGLLFIVYYFNAQSFLIDKNVLDINGLQATGIGLGSFIVAYLIYHFLCKTPLVKKGVWFALLGCIIATGFAFFYTKVFSPRGAYIHFGAMLGTIMAANVFFTIIPAQKAMVKAAKENKPLDPTLGKNAGLRSLHNNYFTLPVLFVMVSNHFPSTFGYQYPWLMLMIISLGTAGVKHWLNLRERGQLSVWIFPVSVLILFAAAYISSPRQLDTTCKNEVSINEVTAIVERRCKSCHSSYPTDDVFKTAPNGVMYNTPADIVRLKDKILQRVVITKSMPQNNKTNMTDEERQAINCWIQQGAKLK